MQNIQTVSLVDTRPAVPLPIFVGSDAFRRAAFGANHPLNVIRHSAVMDLARILGWLSDENFRACGPASVERLLEFHDRAYVKVLQHAEARGRVEREIRDQYQIGTLENPLFKGVFDRAARTVGGSILAAELALEGHNVFHPSGGTHHGRADRACGFCYFNDPVFAIKTFLDAGMEQVYYVDLDAHHGDGVETAFFDEPRVTTLSIHEDYRWPYSGSTSYPDEGAFNVPVARGFNDSEFEHVMENAVLPLAERLRAEALVVCCGADCLAGDPLSTMLLSNVALWRAVEQLLALELPTVVVGGGGYNPWTVTRYWTGLWGRISGQEVPDTLPQQAVDLLRDMECDLVDEEDVDVSWYNTIADSPNPGPVRDSVKWLAEGIVP
ncbi:MAG: acetoin utilization protein AcuC [Gammaproteobacteria bacterium]|nr:acetoin utilization protein AcuC [Gammaproteobacteria bacterium]MDH3864954.1 acetoin utilization protein AcuC [Gammaproteobacteria bacterium]MDH3904242.1 acetoin utilization protein AcuC [Gammaproteobacteria bacterium]MDH3953116.1 acetoin utilization protein AcuC [Gammaproteobacteria bacterium]MDH4004390.1 acetoin utilization protein AcuC [Gammaproteobacteria bacterium]